MVLVGGEGGDRGGPIDAPGAEPAATAGLLYGAGDLGSDLVCLIGALARHGQLGAVPLHLALERCGRDAPQNKDGEDEP